MSSIKYTITFKDSKNNISMIDEIELDHHNDIIDYVASVIPRIQITKTIIIEQKTL